MSVGEERGGWRDAGQDVHTSIQGNQGNRFRPLKSLLCLQLLNLNKIRSLLLGSTITSADQELINTCRQTEAVWKMSGFHQFLLSVFFFCNLFSQFIFKDISVCLYGTFQASPSRHLAVSPLLRLSSPGLISMCSVRPVTL